MIKVGIIGGSGYTGSELLRLLVQHPFAEIVTVTSRQYTEKPVTTIFPNLRHHLNLTFSAHDTPLLDECDVLFFATPHGLAMKQAEAFLLRGKKIIDLSADFRLQDQVLWEHYYGVTHASPQLLAKAVYGLPELFRHQIAEADLVANPGCYPTSVILGLLPLVKSGLYGPFVADCKSGRSGAGRKADIHLLLAESADSFHAYGVTRHCHTPEIQATLAAVAGTPIDLVFVPHLLPTVRGIHATLYADVPHEIDIQNLYQEYYAREPFVDILPEHSHPDTRSVRGANLCRIAVHRLPNSNKVVILSVIDNLVKGAAGQAIQNLNILMDLPETTGLHQVALNP